MELSNETEVSLLEKPKERPEIQKWRPCYLRRIWKTYDRSFLFNLACQYINGGFKALYKVCLVEMFKT